MPTLHINEKQQVENYPYGRLKCAAFFSVEFKKNKGFRSIFQTINPKTGRLNAEKKGNYADILYMKNDNGFVTFHSLSFYDEKSLNKIKSFMSENFELFTPEQIEHIYICLLTYLKATLHSNIVYCGAKLEDIKDFFTEPICLATKGISEKTNLFAEINLDYEGIKSKSDPNYQPFKVRQIA
jgi:hypothetical protein